ncbi:PhzF family phenazine biosynthesis protein [Aestuariispira ectoiniformans]|uniref:PhzF family phenazine biosynthesis protein n=1 Tax=Aestuariispira ectoiniformans TaxID=2775080 RepID=UPI00223AE531|nr:PhzF family phenazine biosynthesis protein [Aestuariispira ectoiniformans]
MELPIYQIDAFTTETFRGNPAAVVPLKSWLPDEVLLKIAAENNLSETAFFVPHDGEEADYFLRWFTPATEVDLCGHATLASSYVLFNLLGWDKPEIRFATNEAGLLTVRKDDDRLELNFPARVAKEVPMPEGLVEALRVEPVRFLRAAKNLAVFETAEQVLSVEPDLDFIAGMEGDGLVITAPGEDCDCASRYFAPHAGIPEDPVTGSAHCTVVPYWSKVLGKADLHARQVSARGGDLYCRMEGDRVTMAGDARLYLRGTIYI